MGMGSKEPYVMGNPEYSNEGAMSHEAHEQFVEEYEQWLIKMDNQHKRKDFWRIVWRAIGLIAAFGILYFAINVPHAKAFEQQSSRPEKTHDEVVAEIKAAMHKYSERGLYVDKVDLNYQRLGKGDLEARYCASQAKHIKAGKCEASSVTAFHDGAVVFIWDAMHPESNTTDFGILLHEEVHVMQEAMGQFPQNCNDVIELESEAFMVQIAYYKDIGNPTWVSIMQNNPLRMYRCSDK